MRRARAGAAAVCALVAMSCTGDRSVPVRPSYPQTKEFARSCPALWPELLQAVDRAGFRLMQHDRSAWVASFSWKTPQLPIIDSPDLDLERLALNEDGSYQEASQLLVDSAVLVLRPQERSCEASIRVGYQVRQSGFWRRPRGKPVSSGLLESVILSGSGSALARKDSPKRRPS